MKTPIPKYCIILLLLLCVAGDSFAQWKKKFDFGHEIQDVYFKNYDAAPLEGFVTLGSWPTDPINKLWRTVDGGISWQAVSIPLDKRLKDPYPRSITFKNRSEGWFCEFDYGGDVYGTTDGGVSWKQIWDFSSGSTAYSTNAIYYIASTNRIIISSTAQYIYSTDGVNYSVDYTPGADPLGIAFSDPLHGIMTASQCCNFLFTSDGGITWIQNQSLQKGEAYQPIGIKGTKTFYVIREIAQPPNNASDIIMSDDGGITWSKIYQYRIPYLSIGTVTGTLQYNSGSIFFQTVPDTTEGIMMSSDSGYTFHSICGPTNHVDTRFYVRDSFIYAGDKFGGLWLNTTGIGSNSTPQLSLAANKLLLQSSDCKPKDSLITFTFFDSCNGIQAKLVSASISGSNNFSLLAPFNNPRTIHEGDSLIVRYDPSTSLFDSAALHLRFHLGWKDFDTVITLLGFSATATKPVLSLQSLKFSGNCSFRDSLITFSYFDSCTGLQAILDSISISGSNNFSLLSPVSFPRIIHPDDSLLIRYNPISATNDSAFVHLHFHLGSKNIDTIIALFGKRDLFPRSVFSAASVNFAIQSCSSSDSLISFSFFDSCSSLQGTLLSASMTGSNNFTLLAPASFPRTVHANDSLLVSYDPLTIGKDTAKLLLHFQLGDQFFDTTISLFGQGRITKENVSFILSSPRVVQGSGSHFDLEVKPDKMISGKGLDSISFDISYYRDLLDWADPFANIIATDISGAIASAAVSVVNPKLETVSVTIRGKNMALDPLKSIARLRFMTVIADTTFTDITMTNLKLNGGDADYKNCILSAVNTNTDFTLEFLCGDSNLYKFIRTGKILDIISIRPNPTQAELDVEIQSNEKQEQQIEIFDELGVKVYTRKQMLNSGKNSIHLDTKSLSSGLYLLKIGEASQSFVKVK